VAWDSMQQEGRKALKVSVRKGEGESKWKGREPPYGEGGGGVLDGEEKFEIAEAQLTEGLRPP